MECDYITLQFHNEYAERMKDENNRQNHRLEALEKATEENRKLALSVERLAISVQSMVEEQRTQGKRLEILENRDGENWRKIIMFLFTTVIGIIVGYMFKKIGI